MRAGWWGAGVWPGVELPISRWGTGSASALTEAPKWLANERPEVVVAAIMAADRGRDDNFAERIAAGLNERLAEAPTDRWLGAMAKLRGVRM
jgi:hypothetical protein